MPTTDLTTKDLTEHTHYWTPRHTQTFSGLVCDCGLALSLASLADLVNRQPNSEVVIKRATAMRQVGPSETK